MAKLTRTRAEERFTATQKKDKQFLKDREKAEMRRAEHRAHLRGLRLAKEAAEKAAAAKPVAEKSESHVVQAHRRQS